MFVGVSQITEAARAGNANSREEAAIAKGNRTFFIANDK